MHLPLGLPSHLSSLLPFLNDSKKMATETSHKKSFSSGKQVHVGMEPSRIDGNDTTTLLHHPYIMCHFANYLVCFCSLFAWVLLHFDVFHLRYCTVALREGFIARE